eukprot:2083574-Prymnesium_polylepis.1
MRKAAKEVGADWAPSQKESAAAEAPNMVSASGHTGAPSAQGPSAQEPPTQGGSTAAAPEADGTGGEGDQFSSDDDDFSSGDLQDWRDSDRVGPQDEMPHLRRRSAKRPSKRHHGGGELDVAKLESLGM